MSWMWTKTPALNLGGMVRSSASVSPWHMVTQLHSMDRISFFGSKSKKLSSWTYYYATRTVSGTSAALYGSIDKCSRLIPPLFSAHWTPRVDSQEPISKIKFYQGKFPEWHFKTIRDLGLDTLHAQTILKVSCCVDVTYLPQWKALPQL